MKITHFCNSFISVRSENTHVVCDPWIGVANYGGWHSFPEFSSLKLKQYLADADWIYISHLHDDHFSPQTIKELDLLRKKFLIKRFEYNTLKKRLASIGVKSIFEVDPFEIISLGDLDCAILPQLSSSSSGLEDTVKFDMDTSIIFRSNDGSVFLNLVDNPYSIDDIKTINKWCIDNFSQITVASIFAGAASEYPQAFINIDKTSEKTRIVSQALDKLLSILSILNPSYYFPAGGTYFIPGAFSSLNCYIAQPTFQNIREFLESSGLSTTIIELEGGFSVDFLKGQITGPRCLAVSPRSTNLIKCISSHSNDDYPYNHLDFPKVDHLLSLMEKAKANWRETILRKNILIHQEIRFVVHSPLEVDTNGMLINENVLLNFVLNGLLDNIQGSLAIHIDARAFFTCIKGLYAWNGVLGSLCLYERAPNIHYPSDLWSVNFFVSRE